MALAHYRYLQPADGGYHSAGPAGEPLPAYRVVYDGTIPRSLGETPQDVLARLVGRHAAPLRPEGLCCRPAGTGDLLDLGDLGVWQVLPVGFRQLDPERLHLEFAA